MKDFTVIIVFQTDIPGDYRPYNQANLYLIIWTH